MKEVHRESYEFSSGLRRAGPSPIWILTKCQSELDKLLELNAFQFSPFTEEGKYFLLRTAQTTLSSKFISTAVPSLAK